MSYFKKIKLNIVPILRLWSFLFTSLLTAFSLLLCFFNWEELHLNVN